MSSSTSPIVQLTGHSRCLEVFANMNALRSCLNPFSYQMNVCRCVRLYMWGHAHAHAAHTCAHALTLYHSVCLGLQVTRLTSRTVRALGDIFLDTEAECPKS